MKENKAVAKVSKTQKIAKDEKVTSGKTSERDGLKESKEARMTTRSGRTPVLPTQHSKTLSVSKERSKSATERQPFVVVQES